MKPHSHKRYALLALTLLLLGLGLSCFLWVRKEQRQYALNRQLIEALEKDDFRQALALVNARADPNTTEKPTPSPSLPSLIKQLLYRSPPQEDSGPTAFLIACGANFAHTKWRNYSSSSQIFPTPQLTRAMQLHGANVHALDRKGATALHIAVISAVSGRSAEYNTHKEVITQLLAYGVDPDEKDGSKQPALAAASHGTASHPDLVALLLKYRKHR